MPYLGIIKRETPCAICPVPLKEKDLVYFDSTKPQGKHLVHKECWENLKKTRTKAKPLGKKVQSSEDLDPPF